MTAENQQIHLEKVGRTLVFLAEKLNSLKIKWLLGGSGALMVYGIKIVPRDLDILMTWENWELMTKEFKSETEDLTDNSRFQIKEIEVQVIILSNLDIPKMVSFEGTPIPVNTLEDELGYYKQRPGKEDIVKLIEEKLLTED